MAGIGKQIPGRPPTYKDEAELQAKIDSYKKYLADNDKPATVAGGAYWLGMDRLTFYRYGDKEAFCNTIKEFREWILYELEEKAAEKGHAGNIFLMKNYGYTDRQDLNVGGEMTLNIGWSGEQKKDKPVKE